MISDLLCYADEVSAETVQHAKHNRLHLPQVQFSLESGHTQASSHHKESDHIQVVSSISFQSGIWNVWVTHTVSMRPDWEGTLGILNFLELGGGFL